MLSFSRQGLGLRSHRITSLASAALVSSALSACHAPAMERLPVANETRAILDPSRSSALANLEVVENQLNDFETIREAAVKAHGYLLLIPAISRRYDQALKHHRQICLEVCERKERVIGPASEVDLLAINAWCEQHKNALTTLRGAIDHIECHGSCRKIGNHPQDSNI